MSSLKKSADKRIKRKRKKKDGNMNMKESDFSSMITESSLLIKNSSLNCPKVAPTKNLLYLHYLKKLCELVSCHSSAHNFSPKQTNKKSDIDSGFEIKKRTKSVSNPSTKIFEDSDNYATLLNTRKNSMRDKFWQNDKVKPIIKLAEDFEFYTDQEEEYMYKCYSSSLEQQKLEDIIRNEKNFKSKNFHFKHLNCFVKKNGSSFLILYFRRVVFVYLKKSVSFNLALIKGCMAIKKELF